MQPNEIINRYVFAVVEHLPRKTRGDIQAELKSLLAEMLEAQATEEGRPVDAAMTVSVVREFGEPAEVAQRYVPQRPLLSAASSANFVMVWKIVVAWIVVFAIGSTMLALANSSREPQAIGQVLVNGLGGFISAMLGSIGVLGIIFFALERMDGKPVQLTPGEKWDPLKLPAPENPNRIRRTDLILTIVGSVFMLIFLNATQGFLGFVSIGENGIQTIPLFSEAFYQFLPWFNVFFVALIVLHVYVASQGRWTRITRIAEIAASVFSVAIFWMVLNNSEGLAAVPAFEPLVRLGVTIALIVVLVDIANNTYRLITKRWTDSESKFDTGLVPNGQH